QPSLALSCYLPRERPNPTHAAPEHLHRSLVTIGGRRRRRHQAGPPFDRSRGAYHLTLWLAHLLPPMPELPAIGRTFCYCATSVSSSYPRHEPLVPAKTPARINQFPFLGRADWVLGGHFHLRASGRQSHLGPARPPSG